MKFQSVQLYPIVSIPCPNKHSGSEITTHNEHNSICMHILGCGVWITWTQLEASYKIISKWSYVLCIYTARNWLVNMRPKQRSTAAWIHNSWYLTFLRCGAHPAVMPEISRENVKKLPNNETI